MPTGTVEIFTENLDDKNNPVNKKMKLNIFFYSITYFLSSVE